MRQMQNNNDVSQDEISLATVKRLVAYEEAKATGNGVAFNSPSDSPLAELADGDLACVDLLHRVWPDFDSAPAVCNEFPPPKTLGDFRLIRELGRGGMGTVFEAEQTFDGPARRAEGAAVRRAGAGEVAAAVPQRGPGGRRARSSAHCLGLLGRRRARRPLLRDAAHPRADAGRHDLSIARRSAGDGRWVEYETHRALDAASGRVGLADDDAPTIDSAVAPPPSTKRDRASPHQHGGRLAAVGGALSRGRPTRHSGGRGLAARPRPGRACTATSSPATSCSTRDGKLYVTDFGLARIEADAGMTMTGDIVGTLRYMAPEQALAKRVVIDHRADVYSLGATLYELLTLQPAFAETDRSELLKQIAFEEPRPLRKLDRRIPAELETIVLKAMAKNPDERYQTAQQLADDLRAFLENRPIKAKPPTLVEPRRQMVAAACGRRLVGRGDPLDRDRADGCRQLPNRQVVSRSPNARAISQSRIWFFAANVELRGSSSGEES